MAFEKVKLFAKIELDVEATAQGVFVIETDVPGNAITLRYSFIVPVTSRRPVSSRLPYNTQGKLLRVSYSPGAGQSRLYGVRAWARELPNGQWGWYPLPVIDSPVEFAPRALPIPVTSQEWSAIPLPIPVTPEEWQALVIEIPRTVETWEERKLPIRPTPPIADWVSLPIDE